jgi:hypothetical protein
LHSLTSCTVELNLQFLFLFAEKLIMRYYVLVIGDI